MGSFMGGHMRCFSGWKWRFLLNGGRGWVENGSTCISWEKGVPKCCMGGQIGRFLSDKERGCFPGDKRRLLSKTGMGCLLNGEGGCWMVEQCTFLFLWNQLSGGQFLWHQLHRRRWVRHTGKELMAKAPSHHSGEGICKKMILMRLWTGLRCRSWQKVDKEMVLNWLLYKLLTWEYSLCRLD